MKKLLLLFLLPGWLFATSITFYVNGVESSTMVQGDEVSWFMTTNQPGGTLTIHIYRDLNSNQLLDPNDQILDFFDMMDNDPNPDGPGDTDGLTNGELDVQLGPFGFAPGDYIFEVVDEDGTMDSAPLHVDPMDPADVQLVVKGQISLNDVSAPNSVYAGFIFGLFTDSGIFMGQTDENGKFFIPINVSVAGGEFDQMFDFASPAKYTTTFEGMEIAISGDTTDVGTISYIAGNLRIHGRVMNQNESPLGRYIYIQAYNNDNSNENEWYVAPDGSYELYMHITQPETLHLSMDQDDLRNMKYMTPDAWQQDSPYQLIVDATSQDEFVNVILYQFTDSIYVHISGGDQDSSYRFAASSSSIYAFSWGYTDPASGFAIIPVSNLARDYWVYLNDWETPPPAGKVLNPQGSFALIGDTINFSFVDPTDINDNEGIVTAFELLQNYPNPFNPSTTIQFKLPHSSRVNLTIFNSLGEKVATLLNNELMNQGAHTVRFDARNLPSGIYLYKIQADQYSATKKMILIK